jgi:hypothetical protein
VIVRSPAVSTANDRKITAMKAIRERARGVWTDE